jgi:glutathione peroxidase
LTPIKDTAGKDGDIHWNFEKFVVSADGKQITRFSPKTKPDEPAVIAAVEAALPK